METNEVSFYATVIYIITISTITTTVLNSTILNNNTLLLSGQQRLVADYFYSFLVKFYLQYGSSTVRMCSRSPTVP